MICPPSLYILRFSRKYQERRLKKSGKIYENTGKTLANRQTL